MEKNYKFSVSLFKKNRLIITIPYMSQHTLDPRAVAGDVRDYLISKGYIEAVGNGNVKTWFLRKYESFSISWEEVM